MRIRPLVPIFWASSALLAYAHVGYWLALRALVCLRGKGAPPAPTRPLPFVTVIVAAYREERVISKRIENLRALDYPADRLEVIVACDGSPDHTPDRAREAGADMVLELPRRGKIPAQDAAVRVARGEIVAFSDANVSWEPVALRALVAPFLDPRVGYVCGQVRFVSEGAGDGGSNQEGVYWRYEMAVRALESQLGSVTAGNGAIYATRPAAYVELDPVMDHDLSFPFTMVKDGWRAVYASEARATEPMVPSITGEWQRKRRMMNYIWGIVLRGGMLDPRGYGPLYTFMIVSHRVLRYGSPFLHLAAFASASGLVRRRLVYRCALALQVGLLAAAALGGVVQARPLLLARYYVLVTASIGAGLWDHVREGAVAGWEPPEGTR